MSIIRHRPDRAPLSNSVQSTASKKSSKKLREVEKSRQFETSQAALPPSCTVHARCLPSKSSGSCGPLALGPQHLACLVLVVLGFSFGTTATQKELRTQKEQHSDGSSSGSCGSGRTPCLARHHRSGPVRAPLRLHVQRRLACAGRLCEDRNSATVQHPETGWLSLSESHHVKRSPP